MKNYPMKILLIAVHLLIAMPLRVIFKIKRKGGLKITPNGKYIITANHSSKLDPFLILASIPFRTYLKLIPTRFVTTQSYLTKWYHRVFLLSLGCVSNKSINKRKPLEVLEERIRNGETIFIFPKGELEKKGIKAKAKVGVIYIEKK